MNQANKCPRDNPSCGFIRGHGGYCALYDACADLADMQRQLDQFKAENSE